MYDENVLVPLAAFGTVGFLYVRMLYKEWRYDVRLRERRRAEEVNIKSLSPEVRAILHKRTRGTYRQDDGDGFTMEEIQSEIDAEIAETRKSIAFHDTLIALENLQQDLAVRVAIVRGIRR